MSKDKLYWDRRFTSSEYIYGKEPDAFLQQMMPRLSRGAALDIAMGEGRNAVYLALKGFEVTGFDLSDKATEKAQRLAKASGVKADLQTKNVDFYLFPVMAFDTIVLTYFKPIPRYFTEIKKALAQGGTFLCVGFLSESVGQIHCGEEIALEDAFHSNELLQHLSGLRVLYYEEVSTPEGDIVRCLAQKPKDKHAVLYGFAKGDSTHKSAQEKAAEALFKKKS